MKSVKSVKSVKSKFFGCILIFLVGAWINIFFTTAIHQILSKQTKILRLISASECIKSLLTERQHLLLFLCFQGFVLLLAVLFFVHDSKPYQSELVTVTPEIKTPLSVGQYQHGSAKWLTDEEKDKAFKSFVLTSNVKLNSGGTVLGLKNVGNTEKIYFIDDNTHLLCIGATRSGKSRTVVIQSICCIGLAGESIVINDPKAELYHYTSEFLTTLGYEVVTVDFKNPEKSHRYNLLQPIIDAVKEDNLESAENLAWDMTNTLVGKQDGEKIWHNGEMSIIAAAILCVVCDNVNRPEYQNLTNVYWFVAEMCKQVGTKMPLLEYVKKLDSTHPARALLSISDVAPARTRGSFYTSALTTLRLFTSKSINSMTERSDFSLADVGRKKLALFIILPDEKTTFYPVASLIISQQYELLANLADRRGGCLERRVNFILDEFGNFTTIADFTNKLTVSGGRGMRFNLFLQSLSQLNDKYDENAANTIKSNCQTWIYLQADDLETLREISDKLGSYTTSSYQLSASHAKFSTPSTSHSLNLVERKLLTVDEVRRVSRTYQIVTSRTHPAMMFSPDLGKWHFNKMLGLGDVEHNRKLREERENKRPIISDANKPVALWNVWLQYQQEILRQMEEQRNGIRPGVKAFENTESDFE